MGKRNVIIDTDCGGDDAIAIMAALTDPNTEVIAITAVWGNVDVDQGMQNLGKLLDFYKRDIPFYRGASGPLVGERETVQWGGFGKDGFGDAGFPPSSRVVQQSHKHAAVAMIDTLRSVRLAEGEVVQLICLGPLTNVALAMRIDAEAFNVLGSETEPAVIAMGGAFEAKGNSNMTAEFNIHCDPEAAHVVFHQREMKPVLLVPWETTVDCCMTWRFFDEWVGRLSKTTGPNKTQIFIQKLFQRLETFTRPKEDGTKADTGDAEATQDDTCVIPDAVAVVAALFPDSILDSVDTYCTVELHGRETRGETCFDWYGTEQSMAKRGRWRNCKLTTSVDNSTFLQIMERTVAYPVE
ncbi:nucleoside hydrolase [Angomonas deanei]|nr:nucleoside hydrolase [Angomonas deanei]EPY28302.1 nucleoside hydrolase [Angomonas deanei]|eukprot:EPY28107.1 nucleoside hydrolase [Angomonas deanei]